MDKPSPSATASSSRPPTTRKTARPRPPSNTDDEEDDTSPRKGGEQDTKAGIKDKETSKDKEKRPATKRARKAVNCEPCRTNKLKCDRNRPCSSCELRGTVSQCYQDARKADARPGQPIHADPIQEISKIRKSLASLEQYVRYTSPAVAATPDPITGNVAYASGAPSLVGLSDMLALGSGIGLGGGLESTSDLHKVPRGSPDMISISDSTSGSLITMTPSITEDGFSISAGTGMGSSTAFGVVPSSILPHKARPAPGVRGRQTGGLYAGATSTSAHLISNSDDDVDSTPGTPLSTNGPGTSGLGGEYDRDLLAQMPENAVVDAMIDYYFLHCQWIYRHIWESSFRARWDEYKSGHSTDQLTLATCCGILALTTTFMPSEHPLKKAAIKNHGPQPGDALFELMKVAQARYQVHHSSYSLELAELILLRGHYLLHATQDGEAIWTIRGQMVTIATAMGLHRDPSQWRMPAEVAERRRLLWWHIIAYERWQAFLLGRPPSIAGHHFDTQLPSAACDPAVDPTGKMYLASLSLFRLTDIVGGIVDDALSLRPVPYSNIQKSDRALVQWMADLPPEWDMSESQITEGLRSDNLATRRLTVQAICIRAACYHIRFSLHRPYAARLATPDIGVGLGINVGGEGSVPETAQSSEIAVSSAERLITLANQCRIESSSERLFAIPGHLAFHSFHLFSAAMFFSFQLIAAPTGARAELYKTNINRAIDALRSTPVTAPGGRVALNAMAILDALAPLWAEDFVKQPPGPEKDARKSALLGRVRSLAFPFHNSSPITGGGTPAKVFNHTINPTGPDVRALTPGSKLGLLAPAGNVFGSHGTIMPDMSVSGRTPILKTQWQGQPAHGVQYGHPPAHPHPQQHLQGLELNLDVNVPRGPYSAEPSSSTSMSAPWNHASAPAARNQQMPPQHHDAAGRRMSLHQDPASGGQDYWSNANAFSMPAQQSLPHSQHLPSHHPQHVQPQLQPQHPRHPQHTQFSQHTQHPQHSQHPQHPQQIPTPPQMASSSSAPALQGYSMDIFPPTAGSSSVPALPATLGGMGDGISDGISQGISQEMPWGASMGIDVNEWTHFMQNMSHASQGGQVGHGGSLPMSMPPPVAHGSQSMQGMQQQQNMQHGHPQPQPAQGMSTRPHHMV